MATLETISTDPITDLTGQVFGDLTVQHALPRAAHPSWLCQCVCGTRVAVRTDDLLNGNKTKCANNCDGRSDDMAARRRLQPPPQPPGLEHKIAAALNASGLASEQLAELIAEVRTSITAANAAAEAAKARYLDPAVIVSNARQALQDADHLSRRLRLALPRLETCHIRRVNAETYNAWAAEVDAIKVKHTAASTRLRQVYTEFEHKLVAALAEARQVDAEVHAIADAKPTELPQANGDARRLPTVELPARHLDGVDQAYSLMHMKIPAFADASRFSWPPVQTPLGVQVAASMVAPRGPGPDWQRELAERDRQRHAESQRVAAYYSNQAREKEERDAALAKAERQRMRNGGAP